MQKMEFQHSKGPIKLCVGGVNFVTTIETLTRFPDSMLGAMFSGRHEILHEGDGSVFIDRDGTHFRHILNFLRSPTSFVARNLNPREITELRVEADFYGLNDVMFPISNAGHFVMMIAASRYCRYELTQNEDRVWYANDDGVLSPIVYCDFCDTAFGTLFCGIIKSFSATHEITQNQPRPVINKPCPMCCEEHPLGFPYK